MAAEQFQFRPLQQPGQDNRPLRKYKTVPGCQESLKNEMTTKKGEKNPFFARSPMKHLLLDTAAPLLSVPLLRQHLCLWLFWGKWLGFFWHGFEHCFVAWHPRLWSHKYWYARIEKGVFFEPGNTLPAPSVNVAICVPHVFGIPVYQFGKLPLANGCF